MPPMRPPGIAGAGLSFGASATIVSVVFGRPQFLGRAFSDYRGFTGRI
jgi:hypothetical protein